LGALPATLIQDKLASIAAMLLLLLSCTLPGSVAANAPFKALLIRQITTLFLVSGTETEIHQT
jgi:hypothetical protein